MPEWLGFILLAAWLLGLGLYWLRKTRTVPALPTTSWGGAVAAHGDYAHPSGPQATALADKIHASMRAAQKQHAYLDVPDVEWPWPLRPATAVFSPDGDEA